MTDIATMPAGPELDALVENVLGDAPLFHIGDAPQCRHYSTWSETAIDALEAWREQHPDWAAEIFLPRFNARGGRDHRVKVWRHLENTIEASGDALALAISRAIAMAGKVGK